MHDKYIIYGGKIFVGENIDSDLTRIILKY